MLADPTLNWQAQLSTVWARLEAWTFGPEADLSSRARKHLALFRRQ